VKARDLAAVTGLWEPSALRQNLVGPSGAIGANLARSMVDKQYYIRLLTEVKAGRALIARGQFQAVDPASPRPNQQNLFVALVPGPGQGPQHWRILGLGRRVDQVSALVGRWSRSEPLAP
jgi:hypothetical protein